MGETVATVMSDGDRRRQRREDMGEGQRAALVVATAVQLALAITAWADLVHRPLCK
jgi:hypothetical protein